MLILILLCFLTPSLLIFWARYRAQDPNYPNALAWSFPLMFTLVIGYWILGAVTYPWIIGDGVAWMHPILFPLKIAHYTSPEGWINYYYRLEFWTIPVSGLIYRDYAWWYYAFLIFLSAGFLSWLFGLWFAAKRRIPSLDNQYKML